MIETPEQAIEKLNSLTKENTLHDMKPLVMFLAGHSFRRDAPDTGKLTIEEMDALMGAYHRIESRFGGAVAASRFTMGLSGRRTIVSSKPPTGLGASMEIPKPPKFWGAYTPKIMGRGKSRGAKACQTN